MRGEKEERKTMIYPRPSYVTYAITEKRANESGKGREEFLRKN
jgi:hypothetical protein